MIRNAEQLDLFTKIGAAYLNTPSGVLDNESLYAAVASEGGISPSNFDEKVPVGVSGEKHNLLKRRIRWYQQDLKRMGLIERVPGKERGLWRLTEPTEKKLERALPEVAMVGFSTKLGVAIWGSCSRVFPHMESQINLVLTSPPYPLNVPRDYGNPKESEWVDFICHSIEPLVARLSPGGTIAINVSNDIFLSGMPARSLYLERMVIALNDRFKLYMLDRCVWENPSKPPGPIQYASKQRMMLNAGWEPVYLFTNDPVKSIANNQRVLQPHSQQHLDLMAKGGEQRSAVYGDGAYRLKPGSFGKKTTGKIPRNILKFSHNCKDQRQHRKDAIAMGLQPHGAVFPLAMAKFLIEYLTEPGQLVVDLFGGKLTVAKAAEELGRRWVVTEWILDYMRASIPRFAGYPGFKAYL